MCSHGTEMASQRAMSARGVLPTEVGSHLVYVMTQPDAAMNDFGCRVAPGNDLSCVRLSQAVHRLACKPALLKRSRRSESS